MADINIDDFFKDAARTIVQLAAAFPTPRAVFVEDVYQSEDTDEFGMHGDRYLACYAALLWLGEEGYVRFEEVVHNEAIDQAVLTARCFTRLCTPSAALGDGPETVALEHATLLHQISEALREKDSTAVRKAMLALQNAML